MTIIREHRLYKKIREFFWKLNCKGIISFSLFRWLFYRRDLRETLEKIKPL